MTELDKAMELAEVEALAELRQVLLTYANLPPESFVFGRALIGALAQLLRAPEYTPERVRTMAIHTAAVALSVATGLTVACHVGHDLAKTEDA